VSTIVVTGASGNVGTALLARLGGHNGTHELIAVSRREPPLEPPYSYARWVAQDLTADDAVERLQDVVRGADAVVHLAWAIQPSHRRPLMRRTNQGGSEVVFEAARRAGVPHLVHVSSIGAYAPGAGRVVDEDWPATGIPTSGYSVDKAAVEKALQAYRDEFTISIVRPTIVLQPAAAAEISRYFLGTFVPTRLLQPPVLRRAPWPSALTVQFVHAADVASAIETVIEARAPGAFNVASGPVIDRERFAALFGGVGPDLPPRVLRAAATASWHARLQPTDPGWVDLALQLPLQDTSRIEALGWQPQHAGDTVLAEFVAALRDGSGRGGPLLESRAEHSKLKDVATSLWRALPRTSA
jgi:nucleoside-diphosphate-sugar epimerase